jgi:hypothetical protein
MRFLDEDSPAWEQAALPVALKPHQRTLLHACHRLERQEVPVMELQLSEIWWNDGMLTTQVGIMADPPGSGKSYVALAVVQATLDAPLPAPERRVHRVNAALRERLQVAMPELLTIARASLIVVPHLLYAQWQGYVAAFRLRMLKVNKRARLQELEQAGDLPALLADVDVLLVTSTVYNAVAQLLNSRRLKMRRVIWDEADTIQIAGVVPVEACFHWLVTASYGNLLQPRGSRP